MKGMRRVCQDKQATDTFIHPSGVFSSVSPRWWLFLDAEQLLDESTDMDTTPPKTASHP